MKEKLTESKLREIIKEEIEMFNEEENNIQYTVVLFGGSIGDKPIRSIRDLIGKSIIDNKKIFNNIDDAKEKAKRMNKILSPGEKKYYRMKYKVVKVKDNKYIK
jgi:hypothetical protein